MLHRNGVFGIGITPLNYTTKQGIYFGQMPEGQK